METPLEEDVKKAQELNVTIYPFKDVTSIVRRKGEQGQKKTLNEYPN